MFITMTDCKCEWSVGETDHSHTSIARGCFGMKRRCKTQGKADSTKKQHVKCATFQKWQCDLHCEHQTMSWLDCNTEKEGTKKVVTTLKCRVCTEFVSKIRGRKKFSKKMDTVMTLIIRTKLTNFISGVRIL